MTARIDTREILTVPEAAKLLKIGSMGVHQAIKRGRLPAIKLGRSWFVKRSDLPKYKASKSVGGRPKKKQ